MAFRPNSLISVVLARVWQKFKVMGTRSMCRVKSKKPGRPGGVAGLVFWTRLTLVHGSPCLIAPRDAYCGMLPRGRDFNRPPSKSPKRPQRTQSCVLVITSTTSLLLTPMLILHDHRNAVGCHDRSSSLGWCKGKCWEKLAMRGEGNGHIQLVAIKFLHGAGVKHHKRAYTSGAI